MARIRFKGLENLMVNRVCDYLVQEGKRVVREALELKKAGHEEYAEVDSGNQMDAYGIIVYYKGRSQRSLFGEGAMYTSDLTHSPSSDMGSVEVHHGWKSKGIPDATGYEWAQMFANNFSKVYSLPKDGFALVVYNAAFYSGILERGGGHLRHKYKVLSQISGGLHQLEAKFKGSKVTGYKLKI